MNAKENTNTLNSYFHEVFNRNAEINLMAVDDMAKDPLPQPYHRHHT